MQKIPSEILSQLQGVKITDREAYLKEQGFFKGAPQSQYSIVFESDIDEPASICAPSPAWLRMAMHGHLIPPVEVYHNLELDHNGTVLNGHILHEQTIPAMTEEEAIEYLIKKDLPRHVWADNSGNRRKFKIVKRESVPTNREYRNAWGLAA